MVRYLLFFSIVCFYLSLSLSLSCHVNVVAFLFSTHSDGPVCLNIVPLSNRCWKFAINFVRSSPFNTTHFYGSYCTYAIYLLRFLLFSFIRRKTKMIFFYFQIDCKFLMASFYFASSFVSYAHIIQMQLYTDIIFMWNWHFFKKNCRLESIWCVD